MSPEHRKIDTIPPAIIAKVNSSLFAPTHGSHPSGASMFRLLVPALANLETPELIESLVGSTTSLIEDRSVQREGQKRTPRQRPTPSGSKNSSRKPTASRKALVDAL